MGIPALKSVTMKAPTFKSVAFKMKMPTIKAPKTGNFAVKAPVVRPATIKTPKGQGLP